MANYVRVNCEKIQYFHNRHSQKFLHLTFTYKNVRNIHSIFGNIVSNFCDKIYFYMI